MCGIVAISSPRGRIFPVERCLAKMQHRGPDDKGVYVSVNSDCHLGHVRLSILDLSSSGHQPLLDSSGRFVISYNGEIYNYLDLKSNLEKLHGPIAWKSGTDTEVIVEGFAREGITFLNGLNGIFALAIYDTQTHLLHLLRDPIGIKPLFLTEQQQSVFFCSELKGLLALPDLKRTLRLESFADQLAFMYVPEPQTMYHEFHKVEPGICFTYRDGKQLGAQALFTRLQAPLLFSSKKEAVESLRTAFCTAVQRQLVADVPVSLFLSGGLDSSAVAQQAVESGGHIKDAYTIAFSSNDRELDAQSDDLHYARFMAKHLGLDLHIIPAKQDFISMLPELIQFMEDGFTDPAAINTFLISKGARSRGVKVMLSGQGADEYLGGYRRYQAENLLRLLPGPLRSGLAMFGKLNSRRLQLGPKALRRRISRLAHLANQSPTARLLGMYTWTSPESIRDLLGVSTPWSGGLVFEELFDLYADDDIVSAMMKVDQRYDLMSLNLCYTDRMSMAVGVEARVPFLDFELVRVMNSIPAGLKVKNWQAKYVLKKAMEPYLPREIIYREKAGFGLPIRAWINDCNNLIHHYLDLTRINKQGIFNSSAVQQILEEQFNGRDHSYTLITLLIQQIWLEANLFHIR